MAIFHTELYEAQQSHGKPPLAKLAGGKLRYALAQYVAKGTEMAGDVIKLAQLKAGAVIVPRLSRVEWEDFGSGLGKLDGAHIGTQKWPQLLAAAIGPLGNGAGGMWLGTSGAAPVVDPQPLEQGDEVVVLEILGTGGLPPGAKLLFCIAYLDE